MTAFLIRHLHRIILALILILLMILTFSSDGYFGGADNITHYLISRYSFRHPELFMNAWGRPLYTILSAPFAQFGLAGIKIFNVTAGLATAWLIYRISLLLKLQQPWMAPILVCFTPLYFIMLPTALTEIIFSLVITFSLYLFIRKNFIASAIVISFLPFARTEGFIMLPLFFLAFCYTGIHERKCRRINRKPFLAIPFLATGVVVFSFLGWFHFKDLFWVFTQFPYPVTYHHPIYNQPGSLWHFIRERQSILGLPIEALFVAGTLALCCDLVGKNKAFTGKETDRNTDSNQETGDIPVHHENETRENASILILLALIPFLIYLAFHSVLYWKAMGGSMGLTRVMAAVLPLASLVAMKGFDALLRPFYPEKRIWVKWIRAIISVAVIFWIVVVPFKLYPLPYPLSPEEVSVKAAATWLKNSPYSGRFVFYADQNVPFYFGKDPFEKPSAKCALLADPKYLDTIPAGSVFIWDAHFGANESKIPIDTLLGNKRQYLLHWIKPERSWTTFGGLEYFCCITETRPDRRGTDNYAIRDSLIEVLDAERTVDTLYANTFENRCDAPDSTFLTTLVVYRGNHAFIMDHRTEFSPGICCQPVSTLPIPGEPFEIRASARVNFPRQMADAKIMLVISFEQNYKPYNYSGLNITGKDIRPGKWDRVSLTVPLPAYNSPGDMVKVYIWNPGKRLFYLDDMRVEVTRARAD